MNRLERKPTRPLAPMALLTLGLVLLAACGTAETPTTATGTSAASGDATAWSFTDDRGTTVTLDHRPRRIAAGLAMAGGLAEYGIPLEGGVLGSLTTATGSPAPALGLADADQLTSVGDDLKVSTERLLARHPDVIVVALWGETDYAGIATEQLDEVGKIAPIVAIRVDHRPLTEVLTRVAELARSLDPDAAPKITAAKKRYGTAAAAFTAANEAKPGLLVAAASGTPSELDIAYPPAWADLALYQKLGMNLVEPTSHPVAGGYWEGLSWELADKYPVDLVLVDTRYGTVAQMRELVPANVVHLPAVSENQLVDWPATPAYGYGASAATLDELTAAVNAADPTLGDR